MFSLRGEITDPLGYQIFKPDVEIIRATPSKIVVQVDGEIFRAVPVERGVQEFFILMEGR